MIQQRIQALDGLRFLAALGVLWIHTWTAHGNPRWYVGKIDIANFLAIGGNGVDLFFVISGFCMYYFYGSISNFSFRDFARFLLKRWIRLSPAFYAAIIIYSLIHKFVYHDEVNILMNFSHGLFYLNEIGGQYYTASHFWTLTTEWQFYFTIPFLLLFQNKADFKTTFIIIFGSLLLLGAIGIVVLKKESDFLIATIFNRGTEFAFGILAAKLMIIKPPIFRRRILWFLISIAVVYAGRLCISNTVLTLSENYYNLPRLLGFCLMGLGFAAILYLSLTATGPLYQFLSNRLFKSMGRISYSFYLFHALIFPPVVGLVIAYLPFLHGIYAPIVSTLVCTAILYPVSKLSFNLLEKSFLSRGNLTTK